MTARKTGTIFWLNVILDHEDLDPSDTLLLVALADHVDEHDRAWPKLRTVARRARVSYSTAKRRMADLEKRGYIARTLRHRPDGGRSTYEVRLVRARFGMSGCAPSPPEILVPPSDQSEPGVGSDRPMPRAHHGEPTEVPSVEPEEEEAQFAQRRLEAVVDDVARRLLALRDSEMPRPVGQRKAWLKRARRRLRSDETMPRAALAVGHPSMGCIGRDDTRDRQVYALAHRHRSGDWPDRPAPRRRIAIADEVSTDVDTPEAGAPMPSSVRDALTGGRS